MFVPSFIIVVRFWFVFGLFVFCFVLFCFVLFCFVFFSLYVSFFL